MDHSMDLPRGDSTLRIGGIAGIVFAVGFVVLGFTVYFDQPNFTDSIADIRDYFADNATARATTDWFSALLFVGGFLLFASALRSALQRSDQEGTWSRLSFAGAVASVAIAGSGVFVSTFTLDGMDQLSDGAVAAFVRADAVIYGAILPWGFAVFLVGASVVMLRGSMFARWFAWFGFATAAANAVGVLWPVDGDPEGALAIVGMVGFMAAMVWILFVASTMARTKA